MELSAEILRLQELLAERDDFLSVIAHELRDPLHTLSLQLSAARRQAEADAPRAVEWIATAQATLNRYIQHAMVLLDLARSGSGYHPNLQAVDLAQMLRRVAADNAARAEHYGLRIEVEAPAACLAQTDAVAVEHIVENLVSNACKHSGCRRLLLSVCESADWLDIMVADDGRGIPPEERERVFDKFERGSNAGQGTGSGLGLWIVRLLARALGGSITLEGGPEGGCVFNLKIPLVQAAPVHP